MTELRRKGHEDGTVSKLDLDPRIKTIGKEVQTLDPMKVDAIGQNPDGTAESCEEGLRWVMLEDEANKLAKILLKYHKRKEDVISLLQDIQEEFGYLPRAVLQVLSKEIHVPEHEIYGVATFYSQFTFNKPGRHKIRVCLGTACHIRGAVGVLEELQRDLKIKPGETSKDGEFSLETVMCLGTCALGPVVVLDEEYHGKMTPSKAQKIVEGTQKGAGK